MMTMLSPGAASDPRPEMSYVFEYDPGFVTAGGGGVTSAANQRGTAGAATATSPAGPDIVAAAVNGQPVFDFDGTASEALAVQGALSLFASQEAIGGHFMIESGALGGVNHPVLTIYHANGVAMVTVTLVGVGDTRKLRVGSRRLASDASQNVDTDVPVTSGEQTAVVWSIDFMTGSYFIKIGDVEKTTIVVQPGAVPGWVSGVGTTPSGNASTAPVIGRLSGAPATYWLGRVAAFVGLPTAPQIETIHLALQAQYATPLRQFVILEEPFHSRARGYRIQTATVTVSIASPGVVAWANHAFVGGEPMVLTTTGTLLTGLTAGTRYYVRGVVAGVSFQLAATVGGAAIVTSGSQSGVHTATRVFDYTATKKYPGVGGDLAVEARLIDSCSGGETLAPAAVGTTSGSTLTFHRVVPVGSHNIQVRVPGESDRAAVTGVTRTGIGRRILFMCHSLMQQWVSKVGPSTIGFPIPLPTPATNIINQCRRHSHADKGWHAPQSRIVDGALGAGTNEPYAFPTNEGSGGNGLAVFSYALQLAIGEPIFCCHYGWGGTSSYHWLPDLPGVLPVSSTYPGDPGFAWNNMRAAIEADDGPGWDFDAMVFAIGAAEVRDALLAGATTPAEYKANILAVRNKVRVLSNNPTMPLYVLPYGKSTLTATTDAMADAFREAVFELIDAGDVKLAYAEYDQPMSDNLHYAPATYERFAYRFARTMAREFKPGSIANSAQGPYLSGCVATAGTNTAVWSFTHNGGTRCKDKNASASGTTFPFTLLVDGVARTITSSALSGDAADNTLTTVFSGDPLVAGRPIKLHPSPGIKGYAGASQTNWIVDDYIPTGDTVGVVLQPRPYTHTVP